MLTVAKFKEEYKKLSDKKNIYVAYSGGMDSRVLLELCSLAFGTDACYQVNAIHINHQISPDANNWQQHCQEICNKLSVNFFSYKVDIDSNTSIETAAREARYRIWEQVLEKNAVLLLAHHARDQTETILQRLFRGCGPRGLSGMPVSRKIGNSTLIRPLLNFNYEDILQFATEHNLSWILDPSNNSMVHQRNIVRHKLLPLITENWPAAIQNINKAAALVREQDFEYEKFIQQDFKDCYNNKNSSLNISKLLALDLAKRNSFLRLWIRRHNCREPSFLKLQQISNEILIAKNNSSPKVKCGSYWVWRYRNEIFLVLEQDLKMQQDFYYLWKQEEEFIILPNNLKVKINKEKLPANAKVELILGSKGPKAKKIFQQHAVPLWQRKNYLQLFVNNKLVQILNLWGSRVVTVCF